LAARNSAKLKQIHLITLAVHALFLLSAFTFRRSLSLKRYLILALPSLVLEYYLDFLGRPKYSADGTTLKRAGEDLDAKGLTEFFWDVIYWTWINLVLVIIFGNIAWWLYFVVPGYTVYALVTTASGLRGMLGGVGAAATEGAPETQSNRSKKMEKRGGQKVAYR
jgi:hypothetical protein